MPPQDENGGSTSITLQFVNALRESAEVEAALGDPASASAYSQAAQKAADAVVRLCWDEGKGLVADTRAKAHFSQQANILAVLADALPAGRRASVLDRLNAALPHPQGEIAVAYRRYGRGRRFGHPAC